MYKFYIYAFDALDLVIHEDETKRGHYMDLPPYDKYYAGSIFEEDVLNEGIWDIANMNAALVQEVPALKNIALLPDFDENDSELIYLYKYIGRYRLYVGELRKC